MISLRTVSSLSVRKRKDCEVDVGKGGRDVCVCL